MSLADSKDYSRRRGQHSYGTEKGVDIFVTLCHLAGEPFCFFVFFLLDKSTMFVCSSSSNSRPVQHMGCGAPTEPCRELVTFGI